MRNEQRLERIDAHTWEIPARGSMRVNARLLADQDLIALLEGDGSLQQLVNVAALPGVVGHVWAMPDVHFGYGFPIGGVAGFDVDDGGVVSPGGVGYDINCGVRLMLTDLDLGDLGDPSVLVDRLYLDVPAGVGSSGAVRRLRREELERLVVDGAAWAVAQGFGEPDDLERCEAGGALPGADPDTLSDRAVERGLDQVGTLGSGNHFLEIQVVDQVFDQTAAAAFGLVAGRIAVMVHCGSRGFGYQVCDDSLALMSGAAARYGIALPDRQLACAPVQSPEGGRYLAAMACAANYAWANRQIIMRLADRALQRALSISPRALGGRLLYDVAHNVARVEDHDLNGGTLRLCVHRKGATRAFAPGHPDVPAAYRRVGQPVIIPGDMGTASYVCRGTRAAMETTFGSTAHGAGRVMSRSRALKAAKGRRIDQELAREGVVVRSRGRKTLAEEMPEAYKDIEQVVGVVDAAGVSPRVARLRPVGVVKG